MNFPNFFSAVLLLLLSKESLADNSCPNGWLVYNQFCFLMGRQVKTWSEARDYCLTLGATLWNVESVEEWEAISPVAARGTSSWIGLGNHGYAQYAGAQWEGPSQLNPEVLPWLFKIAGHGFNPHIAECVAVFGATDSANTFASYYACGSLFNFICKKNAGNYAIITSNTASEGGQTGNSAANFFIRRKSP